MTARDINRLLKPKSIAIVGASETPGALGAVVLANLVKHDFPGDIHLVNPKRETISGRPAVPSVDALPEGVDCAILCIPRVAVLDTVRQLAARKVGAAMIFAAGFAEGGEAGMADQLEIGRIAREAGMIIEGPNCLGSVNYVDRIPLTFINTDIQAPSPGGIGIVSQSGAMAAVLAVMLLARKVDLTFHVSTGNEAANGVEDFVEWMIADEKTRIIAMIVEQFRDPARFLSAGRQGAGGRQAHPAAASRQEQRRARVRRDAHWRDGWRLQADARQGGAGRGRYRRDAGGDGRHLRDRVPLPFVAERRHGGFGRVRLLQGADAGSGRRTGSAAPGAR